MLALNRGVREQAQTSHLFTNPPGAVRGRQDTVFGEIKHPSPAGAVLARGILSVCPSVCLSVTFRYCVQTNEDTIVRFSVSGRTIPLVSGEVKFIRIFAGDHPQRGR